MDEMRYERWGAASGFGAILTGAAAMVFERGALSASDPVGRMVAHDTDNGDALRAQALLIVIGPASSSGSQAACAASWRVPRAGPGESRWRRMVPASPRPWSR
jgi:hypothetical protein